MSIPGDSRDGTRFWGRYSTTSCTTNSSAAVTSPGTCDGDGMMEVVATPAVSSELFQFWKQLALAGLIEGSYSGLSGTAAGGYDVVLGTNIPASRLSSGGWSTNYFTGGTAGAIFNIRYENTLYFGAAASNLSTGNILKPEEAWNIDLKLDDGKAGRGKVIARSISTCTDASDMNDLDASYLLTSSSIACALLFGQAF